MGVLNHWALLAALLLAVPAAHPAPRTFNFVFDGGAFSNSAKAVGAITFEDTLLNNAFDPLTQYVNYVYAIGGPVVLALRVTVSGASVGNGSFSAADFDRVEWQTNGTLDLSQQLVGQPTVDDPWGTTEAGKGGDFNLFGITAQVPTGVERFQLATAGGDGGSMLLTSMVPVSLVPELDSWALLLGGLALLVALRVKQSSLRFA